jgi:D-glycero-D-manno-heptose 1,7-bisphosphate phosphatase
MTNPFQGITCVFLDRDGVINRKPPEGSYIACWSDFHILPGAETAIAAFHRAGLRVIVVSNQRGIALGRYTAADVSHLHDALQQHLQSYGARIDAFYFCPHDKGECDCRKPRPGLFLQAFRDFPGVTPQNSLLIGDSLSDIEAARNLGMRSVFIQGDPATQKPGAGKAQTLADVTAASLSEAARGILEKISAPRL